MASTCEILFFQINLGKKTYQWNLRLKKAVMTAETERGVPRKVCELHLAHMLWCVSGHRLVWRLTSDD